MKDNNKRAVVLLSGGLDSATTLAIASNQGYQCYAFTFLYGQRHHCEIQCAKAQAGLFNVLDHRIINLDMAALGGSALTDRSIEVPKGRGGISGDIPVTYVPARNTVFLSYALAWAEVLNVYDLFIGVNALDYSGYPDCRGEFIEAFEKMANLATAAAVQGKGSYHIHTPIINMTKAQIITEGIKLGVDYSKTHSCYDPLEDDSPCGRCDSCQLRIKGFRTAGMEDPAGYHHI